MDLFNIKPQILLTNLSLKNNLNKNENKNIYPDLTMLNLNVENTNETIVCEDNLNVDKPFLEKKKLNFSLNIDKPSNYIYKKKFIKEYSKEEEDYRNFFLFNYNEDRFFNCGEKNEFDPLIFQNDFKLYPGFVKRIYYTKNTPDNKIVRLSRLTNLYLNMCFENQNFAAFYRVMYYPLYELMTKKLKEINEEDVKSFFIKDNMIKNYGNIEIYYKKENKIIRDLDYNHLDIISYDIKDIQPTFWEYKNFYDYIPICFIPPNYYEQIPFLKHYPECQNLLMSNICFHNNNCHDYWCKTHNYNENQSINYVHNHDFFQELYKFNKNQLIDIDELSKQ